MSINWRSQIDIEEENRFGPQYDPNRVTAVLTSKCPHCGGEITERQFADGRRSYDQPRGVRTVLGQGTYHAGCPDVREDDLRHDADLKRDQ